MKHLSLIRWLIALYAALALAALTFAPAGAAGETTAEVAVYRLNLRTGPGFRYAVRQVLKEGQALTALGRSLDSVWAEVRLPGGTGGWVYARYIEAAASLAGLPVTEAAGGAGEPGAFSCAQTTYRVCVTITDGQAVVNLQRFPASQPVTVVLTRADQGASVLVAEGATGADGRARLTFPMPRQWASGQAIVGTRLTLVAATADRSFSQSAIISYYH